MNQEPFSWERFLEQALRVGVTVGEFWELTPRETYATLTAAAWRSEQDQRRDVALAWHTAALARSRRLPSLRVLLASGATRSLEGVELERRRLEHAELTKRIDVEKLNRRDRHGS